jgi:hypothetical protein
MASLVIGLALKVLTTLMAIRTVLRRSTMFIALNHNQFALQRSAMCSAVIHLHAAPTERNNQGDLEL